MFGELEAKLGAMESKLVAFAGTARAQVEQARAEVERLGDAVDAPLRKVAEEARVAAADCRRGLGQLRARIAPGRLVPPADAG